MSKRKAGSFRESLVDATPSRTTDQGSRVAPPTSLRSRPFSALKVGSSAGDSLTTDSGRDAATVAGDGAGDVSSRGGGAAAPAAASLAKDESKGLNPRKESTDMDYGGTETGTGTRTRTVSCFVSDSALSYASVLRTWDMPNSLLATWILPRKSLGCDYE